jgi:hypothetical protein
MPATPYKYLDPSDIAGKLGGSDAANLKPRIGGGQSIKPTVYTGITRVAAIATAGDSLTLPKAYRGGQCAIYNRDPTLALTVFPLKGDRFNGGTPDLPYTILSHTMATFICVAPGNWNTAMSPQV